jgi:hypothetical protein
VWAHQVQSGEAALGRADELLDRGIGPPHLGQHHLGRDSAIHQPDAPRLAVLPLDLRQEVAQVVLSAVLLVAYELSV